MKSVMQSGKKGKLSPWYVGCYEILEWISKVAYILDLPSKYVYDFFGVSCVHIEKICW